MNVTGQYDTMAALIWAENPELSVDRKQGRPQADLDAMTKSISLDPAGNPTHNLVAKPPWSLGYHSCQFLWNNGIVERDPEQFGTFLRNYGRRRYVTENHDLNIHRRCDNPKYIFLFPRPCKWSMRRNSLQYLVQYEVECPDVTRYK